MLDSGGLTAAELLPARFDDMEAIVGRELGEDPEVREMKLVWSLVGAELEESLRGALDRDVLKLLAEAWAGLESLREYGDRTRHPPEETTLLHFGAHDFVRNVDLVVAVTIGQCPCKELRFTLSIGARFEGVGLSVKDGHIISCVTGEAALTAALKFDGIPLHKPATSPKMVLPGRIAFEPPGLTIPLA